MTATIIQIAVLVILIILSSFFSSAETALTAIAPHKVRTLVEEGVKKAEILDRVLSNREKMLSVILICNNIVNLSASALMTIVVQKLLGNAAVSLGTGVLTFLILIFGEITPKTLATYRAEKIALRYCRVIYVLMITLTPISAVLTFISGGVLKLLGVKEGEKSEAITEKELRTIVEVSSEEGIIETNEKEIINNIFDFSNTVVREIMVPRLNIKSISINSTYNEIMETFLENYFTRLPVYDEDGEKITGIVNVKDLVFYDRNRLDDFHVKDIMREAEYTYELKGLPELFLDMKNRHIAMMVVLDEYGDTAGIVTFEDILEELVGDIRDEYDENEASEIVQAGKNEYIIHGHVSLDDVNETIGTELSSDDYDSIGGLMIEHLGRIPNEGDTVRAGSVVIKAERVDNTRIELVRVKIEPDE